MKQKNVLMRLMKHLFKQHGIALIAVLLCILGSALANVQGTLFMQALIDDYIMPLIGSSSPDYSGLLKALSRVAVFYGMVFYVHILLIELWLQLPNIS